MLFHRFLRHQGNDEIARIFLKHSGGFAIFVPLDLSAWRIRSIPVYAGHFKRHTVDTADMCAGTHNGYRRVTASPVQIIAGGGAFFKKSLLVVSPALDPLSGSLMFLFFL